MNYEYIMRTKVMCTKEDFNRITNKDVRLMCIAVAELDMLRFMAETYQPMVYVSMIRDLMSHPLVMENNTYRFEIRLKHVQYIVKNGVDEYLLNENML